MPNHSAILLELHYLPSVQYCTKFLMYSTVIIEQQENYSKGSYRNRCHIASANGLLKLSIPLKGGKHQQLPIRDTRIAYEMPWQNQHWQSIQSAYGNAPYFEYYADEIRPFYEKKHTFLFDFNWALQEVLFSHLGIDTAIQLSQQYEKETQENTLDFRNKVSPKANKVPDSNFAPVKYSQVFEEKSGFLPNLSILDLLFCSGPHSILILEESIATK